MVKKHYICLPPNSRQTSCPGGNVSNGGESEKARREFENIWGSSEQGCQGDFIFFTENRLHRTLRGGPRGNKSGKGKTKRRGKRVRETELPEKTAASGRIGTKSSRKGTVCSQKLPKAKKRFLQNHAGDGTNPGGTY